MVSSAINDKFGESFGPEKFSSFTRQIYRQLHVKPCDYYKSISLEQML